VSLLLRALSSAAGVLAEVLSRPPRCAHAGMRFAASTGIEPHDARNATVGVTAICDACGGRWVGDVVAGVSPRVRSPHDTTSAAGGDTAIFLLHLASRPEAN
jgi:hypothetical protein